MKRNGRRISLSSLALALLIQITLEPHQVAGYGLGADPSVCKSMVPGHGAPAQTGPNPYKVIVNKTDVQGTDTVDITLTSTSGTEEFKGFFIQVRKPNGDKPISEFKGDAENARTMKCEANKDAMTHPSPASKKSVTVQWVAPNDEDGEYQIYYTVVKDGGTYWTHIPHPEKIRVARNVQAAAAAAAKAPIVKAASPDLLAKWRDFYGGCGENKGCFGLPPGCVEDFDSGSSDPTTCDMMVTWAAAGEGYEFALTGKPGGNAGYVAVGFSTDDKMGEDSVVGCGAAASAAPAVQRYINPSGYSANKLHTNPTLALKQGDVSNLEENLFCKFTHEESHEIEGITVNLKNDKHYLLLSRGSREPVTGLGKHEGDNKGSSSEPASMHDNIIMGATTSKKWLVQIHGSLMVLAWLMCASTGMFTARYFKLTHTDFMPLGKAFWFFLHVFCMASTLFLTICGAVFILVHREGFKLQETHSILGVIVVCLAILQVLGAFFRPHPGTSRRPIFNWLHWGIGNAAHIIGIACIFLAFDLSLADLKRFGDENLWLWILLAIVLFHVLMHIVMSIHTLWADKQMEAKHKKRALTPGPLKPNGQTSEAPGTAFRTFMLALYLIIMSAGAITLLCLICWPKKDNTS